MKTEVNWFYSVDRFSQLMNYDPRQAYLYAKSCGLDMKDKMDGYKEEWDEEPKSKKDLKEELTLSEMKRILKENDIKFHHMSKEDKLLEIMNDNWLLNK